MKNVKIPPLKILEFLHSVIWQKKLSSFVATYFHFLSLLVPITHYMHVATIWERVRSPTICKQVQTRFFFPPKNDMRTRKVLLLDCTAAPRKKSFLSDLVWICATSLFNEPCPRQMWQSQLAPMAKNMTFLESSDSISKMEKRGTFTHVLQTSIVLTIVF